MEPPVFSSGRAPHKTMTLALAAILLQTKDPGPIVLPPGSSQEFQATVFAVEEAVQAGNWTEAARLAERLPGSKLTVQWDETGLTETQKLYFARARDEAIKLVSEGLRSVEITLAKPGKLKIGFVPSLPPNTESPGPAGAVYFGSPAAGDPVLEGVIALFRGSEKRPVEQLDVRNEVAYAIGSALGLARQPKPLMLMYRSEDPYVGQNKTSAGDALLFKQIVEASDRVRMAVAEKRDPGVAAPEIFIEPSKLSPPPVGQAERMALSLQVTNRGKGTLEYRVVPDCGCFVLGQHTTTVKPGDTVIVPMLINTFDFVGKLTKHLYIYSNDPESPVKAIPFETIVRPAYRFVNANPEPNLIVDESGGVFETTLVLDDTQSFKIKRVSVNGISAVAEVDEKMWEGTIANPEIGEGPTKHKGYKIRVLVAPNLPPGRLSLSLEVQTDSDVFKTLYHSVYVQRGIVAVPLSIYFGTLGKEPVRASVVLTRPGRPYKVLRVASDTESVVASVEPYNATTEYKIVATYNGKAPIGGLRGTIKVFTDDPKQPVIEVPFEGTVR